MNSTNLHREAAIALNDPKVLNMSMSEMIDHALFHRIMGVPGVNAGCRYRITDKYMELVTEYAESILTFNRKRGITALKFALQRIANSTLYPLRPIEYNDVPQEYLHLATCKGENGIPSQACYNFLFKHINLCLSLEETKENAQKLLINLIANIQPNGEPAYDVYLSDGKTNVNGKQLRDWAYNTLRFDCGHDFIYSSFATPKLYRCVPEFWQQSWLTLDKKDLAKRLKVKGLFKTRKLKKMLNIS